MDPISFARLDKLEAPHFGFGWPYFLMRSFSRAVPHACRQFLIDIANLKHDKTVIGFLAFQG